MALPGRFEPRLARRALAAFASAALHFCAFLALISTGGRPDGVDTGQAPTTQLVLLKAPDADRREGVDLPPLEPTLATAQLTEQLDVDIEAPASLPPEAIESSEPNEPLVPPETVAVEPIDTLATNAIVPAATFLMSQAERSSLSRQLARLTEEAAKESRTQVDWKQDGRQYSAELILERANDGTALDRVIAEVSAMDRGRKLSTRVILRRLAFSQFAQMVDRWDPMVQLHDDTIVGRFHTNSRFNVMHDSHAAPQLLGKVSTSARSFDMQSISRRVEAEIFRAGVETRASRIDLPEGLRPSDWAPEDGNARIHELANDTRIRFFADGSYTWRTQGSPTTGYLNAPSDHPVYFIAARTATVFVKGVVAGKILVYSPLKIVVEGNLTYAHDPRGFAGSPDYLGLVSDKYVEVAPPGVTGPGDLQIEAAILAGRRFVVRDIEHRRSATLRIYGSLAAGSLSASEPRYATKIEYDERFERRRPPGFPSTNRYEVEDWNGEWREAPERMVDDTL